MLSIPMILVGLYFLWRLRAPIAAEERTGKA